MAYTLNYCWSPQGNFIILPPFPRPLRKGMNNPLFYQKQSYDEHKSFCPASQ